MSLNRKLLQMGIALARWLEIVLRCTLCCQYFVEYFYYLADCFDSSYLNGSQLHIPWFMPWWHKVCQPKLVTDIQVSYSCSPVFCQVTRQNFAMH